MRQIVTHFTDQDLYSFSVCYYILQTYPQAEVEYEFFDRNKMKYPKGFAELLQEQVNGMANVVITNEELRFMRDKVYFLPEWFLVFLKGYRFNPNEVSISQDEEGYLSVKVKGPWYSTVFWEMPLLSTISELHHELNGDLKKIDIAKEYDRAWEKARLLLTNGVSFSDMGTRRRASFDVQDVVISALNNYALSQVGKYNGKFVGTSNVYFAMKYGLTPIGTMSHQIICAEECVSGVHECNAAVMRKWSEVFGGHLGTYLYDAFGDDVFFSNISAKDAKLYDGLRVDSGDNMEQFGKIISMYEKNRINPTSKSIIFSNALDGHTAVALHKEVNGRVKDSCGIGTWLTCNFDEIGLVSALPIKNLNIVIKLVRFRVTPRRPFLDAVKLSCDEGKTLGNAEKCQYLLGQLKQYKQ